MGVKVGLHILGVKPDGVAGQAGLQVGDVLIKYNSRVISGHGDLVVASADASKEKNCDKPVMLTIVRDGKELVIEAVSGKLGATLQEGPYRLEGEETGLSNALYRASDNLFLIGVLDTVAWIALIIGIMSSFVVLGTAINAGFGMTGFVTGVFLFIQSFIVFALLKVIATMAVEVKSIKQKLEC